MADYVVSVEETSGNVVSVQDIVNAVTVTEAASNSVTVVASTFVNDAGASSKLYYAASSPPDTLGNEGDFFIDTSAGKLWGPKGESSWGSNVVALIPKRFVFTQGTPSATWNITHTLDGFPSVTVIDSAGTVVIGEVSYNSTSSVTVSFSGGFSGKAYLT